MKGNKKGFEGFVFDDSSGKNGFWIFETEKMFRRFRGKEFFSDLLFS